MSVPDELEASPAEPSIFSFPQPGVFTFYVPGFGQPLRLTVKEEILIGRYQDGLPAPDIDLTAYYGYLSGVSRRHAKIRVVDSEVILVDLGSSNGTWVNESKLMPHQTHPLKNGDIIRLGQLLMFIYFQSVELPEQTLLVRDTRGDVNLGLTANAFSDGLLQLLNSIQELEKNINGVQDQPSPDVQIKAVSFDKDRALIQARLVGAHNAVEFIKDEISKRRDEFAKKIQGTEPSPEETLPSPLPLDLAMLGGGEQMIAELIDTLLQKFGVAPLDEEKKKEFVAKIQPLIKTILTSPFEIIIE
ncbi:MAG: FHA domain-containing protein [Chloroflexi bacterium]|nr:FHA domain-containing protein [Chloroflexota bacterium]